MAKAEKVYGPQGQDHGHVWIYCPACKTHHVFDSRWTFNGDFEKPTFSPSMLIKTGPYPTVDKSNPMAGKTKFCHSFVRNGQIEYLNDCTHDLAGQTIELPDIED